MAVVVLERVEVDRGVALLADRRVPAAGLLQIVAPARGADEERRTSSIGPGAPRGLGPLRGARVGRGDEGTEAIDRSHLPILPLRRATCAARPALRADRAPDPP